MAGQHLVLFVRPSLSFSLGQDVATLPVDVDASGGGSVIVSTAGLAIGNYIVGIAGADAAFNYRVAAFGMTDPGILGPRVVRIDPLTNDDVDG